MKLLSLSSLAFLLAFTSSTIAASNDMSLNKQKDTKFQSLEQISPQKWKSLSQKNIFFGHQSVGNNIIKGIEELQVRNENIQLKIVETEDLTNIEKGFFSHFSNIGKNQFPYQKIEEFSNIISRESENKPDIAFLKFCFVDFNTGEDIDSIFNAYRDSIENIRSNNPNIEIVHFTVPLLIQDSSSFLSKIKKNIKKLLGKKVDEFWSNGHNVVRNNYNRMLLDHYLGKEPVFDIASLESTHSDGSRETFSYEGKQYFALAPEYSDDGGHLNKKGRQYIAENLLVFLANLP